MSSAKPTPRAPPAASAPPNSPRTEENQGYRRGRAIRSCLECRRRKMRCNRSRPCQNCNRFCRQCVYLPFPDWPAGAPTNVKLEADSQGPEQDGGRYFPSFDSSHHTPLVQPSPFTHHDRGYHSDTLSKHDGLYDIDADDESLDFALQVGRLSITEKNGGLDRPHVASQIAAILSQTAQTVSPYTPQAAYGIPTTQPSTHSAAPSPLVLAKRILPLEPSPGFLATASQAFLPQLGLELPTRDELHLLYYQYWSAVDPLAHIIHKPSFEEECRKYLVHGLVNDAAPASFKALLLAMCLAAAVSLLPTQAKEVLGITQQALVSRLKIATEKALRDANFMGSVKIQNLQAFATYLVPQCRAEISRSHALYVGALIRLAMGAGLNRDVSGLEVNPVDCQVRRLLWHQICFLDLITAEAQGPQPVIHDEDFDTPLPLNINDDARDRSDNEPVPVSGWTDATFSIIRYECCMVHRLISRQRLAIENGQIDLKRVQQLVNVRKIRIERQYLQNLDEAVPIQRCAKIVGRLFTARFDAILLHRHSQIDVNSKLPSDIRETLIQSCLTVCECAAALDTDPDLVPWAWYARAHHQYERSIYLLMEVHRDPYRPQSDRINAVLDHIFGSTPNLSSRARSRNLLQLLSEEFAKMTRLRRVKTSQLSVSDNGSSSPGDMAKTPEEGQHWGQWQPDLMYGHGYRRDLPPVGDGVWWPLPTQHGMVCSPEVVPKYEEYTGPQHDEYGFVIGSGAR